eukprot:6306508-Heterocapsa_arctica.AAC.1
MAEGGCHPPERCFQHVLCRFFGPLDRAHGRVQAFGVPNRGVGRTVDLIGLESSMLPREQLLRDPRPNHRSSSSSSSSSSGGGGGGGGG